LAEAGYEVLLVAPHDKDEIRAGVRVLGVRKDHRRLLRMTRTVYAVYKAAVKANARLYHFHDAELATIALLLKLHGKRVIFDVHEDLPEDILAKAWLRFQALRRIVAALAVRLETVAARVFDGIVAATPDIAAHFAGADTEVVHNYPMIEWLDKAPCAENARPSTSTVFVFTVGHFGGLNVDRCIREVVAAMEWVGREGELWLIGEWADESFRAECARLEGFTHCKVLGLLPLAEAYGYMKCADVGVALWRPMEGFMRGIPTKAFEYMAMSLPMIMSDFPLWRYLFSECALFVDPLDPRDIAAKMRALNGDRDLRRRLGAAGRRLVDAKYSWEGEASKLQALYARMLAPGGPDLKRRGRMRVS